MARVQVADDVWADFRDVAYPHSIAHALGELVTNEVDRYRSRRIKDGQLDPRELVDALGHARRRQEDLTGILERLEALARR